ncbi:hypothetical protein ACFL0V_02985 [Nanoarchaeota archaeon]
MKKYILICLIFVLLTLSACYTPPKYSSDADKESPDTEIEDIEYEALDEELEELEELEALDNEEPAGLPEDLAEPVEEQTTQPDTSIPKPECDGRLVEIFNVNNEVTGYRCVEDADSFECPGHRAGETWEEDGKECTCKSNGSIECVSEE